MRHRARAAGAAAVAAALAVALLAPAAAVAAPRATGDLVRSKEYWLDSYGIRSAWNVTKGAGVTIAIIDSGVDGSVAELRGAVTAGADFSGSGTGGAPEGGDGDEHGTMVASLAAGRGAGANAGVLGVAPAASLISASVGFGTGDEHSDQEIADAVTWSVDHGAKVINLSLTRNTLDWPESWDKAFLYAEDHDVVIVAAAGNRGSGTEEVSAPATMPGVLGVGGVTQNGASSTDASAQGITLGIAAPSENLVGVIPGGGYVLWDGTSGAAPIVSGVVALVRAAHPESSAADVINRILATAHDKGAPGPDDLYGYGLIDAAAAVRADVPSVTANPLGDLHEWVRINRRAVATPSPAASPGTIVAPAPVAAPQPRSPVGTLLPSAVLLQVVGLPALVVLLMLFVLGGLIAGAVLQFRGLRRTR
ncbi:MAG TPA: S8 family serine peptidase [Pseudolysinimonas sp.]|nr:S8 family serine peptidase [Pseudolysinimonas sp.]